MARFLSTVWAVITGTLLFFLAVNTLGYILFAAAVGLFMMGLIPVAILLGAIGMFLVFKTDDAT